MPLTVATYKTCPNCQYEFGTAEDLKSILGMPHLSCPSCRKLIPTGQQPWSAFDLKKKAWFLFTRVIQFSLAAIIIAGLIIRQLQLNIWLKLTALILIAVIVIYIQSLSMFKKIGKVEDRYRRKDFKVRDRL